MILYLINLINMLELEKENLGKPINPKIEINPEKASETIPQAWEKKWNWYYNWEWAMAECKFLKKRMPTKEEWKEIVKSYWEDWKRLSKNYDLPFAGSYNNWQSTDANYWSSSTTSTYSYYLYFYTSNIFPTYYTVRAYGFSVRCIKN